MFEIEINQLRINLYNRINPFLKILLKCPLAWIHWALVVWVWVVDMSVRGDVISVLGPL